MTLSPWGLSSKRYTSAQTLLNGKHASWDDIDGQSLDEGLCMYTEFRNDDLDKTMGLASEAMLCIIELYARVRPKPPHTQ